MGDEQNRSWSRNVSSDLETGASGDNTGSEKIHYPTEIGIFGKTQVGSIPTDAEMVLINGSDGGSSSEDGKKMTADNFRLKVAGNYGLGGGGLIRGAFTHRTLSYSDQAFMTLENMPLTAFRLTWLAGNESDHFYLGGIYVFGQDTQSLPQFNAKYRLDVYAGTLGVRFGL